MGADCDRAAGTLDVRRGKPFSLTPDAEYGAAIDGVMGSLQVTRRVLRQRLGKARTRYQQQEATGRMRATYLQSARKLARMRPPPAAARAHADLEDALTDAGGAYGRLQKAALAFDTSQWNVITEWVQDREADVQGALDALKPLGYTIQ